MAAPNQLCPSCETPLPDAAAYCPQCGIASPTEISQETGEDRTKKQPDADEAEHRERLQRALGEAYELRELIGQGGFGAVYAAWEKRLAREVAVKAIRFDLFPTATLLERFRREARAVAKLRHPNIVPVYTFGEDEGLAYIIMPRIEGESLKNVLKRKERLSIDEACRVLEHVAQALDVAHKAGVVHRDVKPENIMLEGEKRRVLLMDFGIAKGGGSEGEGLTMTGMVVGSPAYMSPEQAVGETDIDNRSDIYSLGVVAFQILTGQLPFKGPSPQALIAQRLTEEPPDLQAVRADVPEQLAHVVGRCLAKEREDRWPGVEELLTALGAVHPERAPRKVRGTRVPRWKRRSTAIDSNRGRRPRPLIIALVITLLVLGGGVTIWQMQQRNALQDALGEFAMSLNAERGTRTALERDLSDIQARALFRTRLRLLIDGVQELELNKGIENALSDTLQAALASSENDHPAAIQQVQAFLNQVEAMRGNQLTNSEADELISKAQEAIEGI